MSLGTFRRILNNICGSGIEHLLFSGYAENFLNPNASEMMLLANQVGLKVSVITTGIGLSKTDIDKLTCVPFRRFAFSLKPPRSGYQDKPNDPDPILTLFDYSLPKLMNVQVDVVCHPNDRHKSEMQSLKLLAESKQLPFRFGWHDRAGNLGNKPAIDKQGIGAPLYCSRPLTNVVQPNGDVALCCMDWSLRHTIGNLHSQKYIDIVSSVAMKSILRNLHEGRLTGMLCRHCHYLEKVNGTWRPIEERWHEFYSKKS